MKKERVSSAEIQKAVGISHQAASKVLKNLPFTLVKVKGSDKPVKMYEVRLLPVKWREKLEIWIDEGDNDGNDTSNNTDKRIRGNNRNRPECTTFKTATKNSDKATATLCDKPGENRGENGYRGDGRIDLRYKQRNSIDKSYSIDIRCGDVHGNAKHIEEGKNDDTYKRHTDTSGDVSILRTKDGKQTTGFNGEGGRGTVFEKSGGGDGETLGRYREVRKYKARAESKYLASTDEIPDIANPKQLTTADKLAIIGYLKASPHQNNAIKALNSEYRELELTKQRACRWKADFRKHGVRGLEDGRGRPRDSTKADETLIKQALFASGTAHLSSGYHCYCLFYARRRGKEFDPYRPVSDISEGTFRRITERLKKSDKQLSAFLRVGKDGIKDLYPALPRHFKRVNQEWQIDATKLDFFVLKDGEKVRPTVVAIVDCYSGARVWGLYDSATSLADVRLLKKAIENLGVPDLIRGDNGADYVSEHFQGVLSALGIAYHAAQAGKGRQKGKIERSFGSVQHSWLENLPGFIGHEVKQRSSIEAQQIEKLERLAGAATHTKCLPWETFAAVIDEYLAAKMESSGAAKKYREAKEAGRIREEPHLHRYLGKTAKPTVSAKGLQAFGRTYGGYEFWMRVHIGQTLVLREDIDDIARAYIFDMDGNYICEAIDNNLVSLTAEQAKAIMAHHKATYISPARRMIKTAQEAGDAEYAELAKLIAGEIKELGKTKLDEKLKVENKAAVNKPIEKGEEKRADIYRFNNPIELVEAAIREGWTDDPRVQKIKKEKPEQYAVATERAKRAV